MRIVFLKSSISTKSTTRKGKPPLKPQKHLVFTEVFLVPFSYFSGRALAHNARVREKLRVLVNPIASTCQPNCEYLSTKTEKCDYLNAIYFSIYSQFIILQHKYSQTHEKEVTNYQGNALTEGRYDFNRIEKNCLYKIIEKVQHDYIENQSNEDRGEFKNLHITLPLLFLKT